MPQARPWVEALERRDLLSTTLGLTPLVQVSDPSPLGSYTPPGGQYFPDSEVEPQISVDPTNAAHAVAVWQQDRYSGSGARALVVSVSSNAGAAGGATWTAPAAIPGFDGSVPTSAYQRYSDPWVSFAPNGDLYASALAFSFSAGFPTTSAILASKSTDGGLTWSAPATLVANPVPPGSDPEDLLNDKEAITADPTDPSGKTAYVIWDRLNQPSDNANFNAYHGFGFRADTLFAKTTDGGATWDTRVLFAPQANEEWIGHSIVVMPTTSAHPGRLVDLFSLEQGSGSQGLKSARNKLAVIYSDDGGATWSGPVIVGDQFDLAVTDPDTGAAVRVGEPLPDFAVDPINGNLYAVWLDARFSNYKADGVVFAMSSDGGLTWSAPIQVNQTPTDIAVGNQQAFVPSVAVNSDGTVAVTYYDFRKNTPAAGVPTDYWLVHASGSFTDPASWSADEKRLTCASFNMENAANTGRGYFLGDYAGLAAAGKSFYALFAQAGTGASDPSNIWFRDPPPAESPAASAASSTVAPSGGISAAGPIAADAWTGLAAGTLAENLSGPPRAGLPGTGGRQASADWLPPRASDTGPLPGPAAQSVGVPPSRDAAGTALAGGEALVDALFSDGWDDPPTRSID
jgi:hypothetical protein